MRYFLYTLNPRMGILCMFLLPGGALIVRAARLDLVLSGESVR